MSRRYRRKDDSAINSHRWIVSYADFITVLFAFFVVMYALSSIEESKYKLFAANIDASFSSVSKSLLPVRPKPSLLTQKKSALEKADTNPKSHKEDNPNVASELKKSLKELIVTEKILFNETEDWVEITLNANVLFKSASAELTPAGVEIMKPIAENFKSFSNPVQVEGFTDNVPIYNDLFPSNWELSSARSSSVARQLMIGGIDATRLAAVGYGDNFPIRDNATPKGREANRRVILLISKNGSRERLEALKIRWLSGEGGTVSTVEQQADKQADINNLQIKAAPIKGGGVKFNANKPSFDGQIE